MRRNRHDTYKQFCDQHQQVLAATGLPATVTHSEPRFRELLEAGHVALSQARPSLAELTPDGWAALCQFAAAFFREFESYAPDDRFPGLKGEAERRGDKFPR